MSPLDPNVCVPIGDPVSVRLDGPSAVQCLETLLATQRPPCPVELSLVPAAGPMADFAWLAFVTHTASGWWERTGLAVDAPGLGEGRRMVLDLEAVIEALHGRDSARAREVAVLWSAEGLATDDRLLPVLDAALPPIPEIPAVRDTVTLPPGGLSHWPRLIESEQGRITIPGPVMALLHARGVAVAAFGVFDGDVYLVAQAESGAGSSAPLIVARAEMLMWSDAALSGDFRERRRRGGNEVEQLLMALDPATPPVALLALLDTAVGYVRRRVAAHPALPLDVMESLCRRGTRTMRAAVAVNPALPEVLTAELAADDDPLVREAVAGNRQLRSEIRWDLAADPVPEVRRAVAAAATNDSAVLGRLATDPERVVRAAVAANPRCPTALLEQLVTTEPFAVLGNPAAPEALLVSGAREMSGALRALVAASSVTPVGVLVTLARDPDMRVARAVIANPRTPAAARRRAEKRVPVVDDADLVPRVVMTA